MATDQISQECGRKIMGDNMFGAKEVVLHLGFKPSKNLFESMIPFSKRTLEQVRKTHLLIISERAEWWLICKNQSSSYKYKKRKIQIIILNASYLYFLATGKRLFAMSEKLW
ncbi:MAG: hypothetical protein AAB396_02585 [Patescibacteria group bacterium]